MTTPLDTIKSAVLGVPFDAAKKPSREGVVKAFAEMQVYLDAAQSGALVKDTYAALDALATVPNANIMAWVVNDPTPTLNGIYENTGTAGTPVFTRRADIPQFFITATNVGDGTANAIQAETNLPVPTQDGRALIGVNSVAVNTGAMTLQLNGGTVLEVVSKTGGAIAPSVVQANDFIFGFISDSGTKFRLFHDQAQSALLSQTETARDAAENYLSQIITIVNDLESRIFSAATLGILPTNTIAQNDLAIADVVKGAQVDFENKLIPATKVPTGFFHFNGTIEDGSGAKYPLTREPYESILSGNMIEIKQFETGTFWPVGHFHRTDDDQWWFFWIETPTHGAIPPQGILMVGISNGSFKISQQFTIDTDSLGYLYNGAIAHQIESGGYLVVVRRWNGSAIVGGAIISDGFAAPTLIDLEAEGIADDPFWFGQEVRWPAEFGGHDTKGWLYASYAGASASARIVRTNNEGATGSWSQVTIGGNITGFTPNECSIVVIAGEGAIAFCRGDDGQNMHYSVSTDSTLSTWSTWTDSGIAMGDNPPHAVYHHGILELCITDREIWSDIAPGSGPSENVVRRYKLDPTAIFATGGELPAAYTVDYDGLNRMVGYMQTAFDKRGLPITTVKVGETQFVSSTDNERASLAIITPLKTLLASPQVIKRQPRQLLLNSNFQLWPYGNSFTTSTDEITAANWRTQNSGSTMNITREDLSLNERRMVGHGGRYAMGIENASDPDDNTGLVQRRRGRDGNELAEIFHSHARGIAVLEGFGVPPSILKFQAGIEGISGAANQFKNTVFVHPVVRNNGFWRTETPVDFPRVPDGASFVDTTYGYVVIDNSTSVSPGWVYDDIWFTRAELWLGDTAGHRDAIDHAAQRELSARYGHTYTASSGSSGVILCPMIYRAGGINAWQGFFDVENDLITDLVNVDFSDPAHFEIVTGATAVACSAISGIELTGSHRGFTIQAISGSPSDGDWGFLRIANDSAVITWTTGY